MANVLHVYLYNQHVGRLWLEDGDRFRFQYSADCDDRGCPRLSIALPVRPDVYEDAQARPFFANLLPEQELHRAVARQLGISDGNDFAMLAEIGGECAGAVSVLPEGRPLPDEGHYQPLSPDELHTLIGRLPQRPFLAGEPEVRLSLAGAQNKLPVYYDDNQVSLPLGGNASTHIIKPPMRDFEYTVENEAFCMELAGRVDLPVPHAEILDNADRLYLVERYDRSRDAGGVIRRIHQEDFCQSLGIPPAHKYEAEGGPSAASCLALVKEHSAGGALRDQMLIVRWLMFNYLIGNADAHGKNIAFLLPPEGPRLAPFYDLMSTAVYGERLSPRMAMNIGGKDKPQEILARHWLQLGEENGINPKLIRRVLLELADELVETARALAIEFQERYGACPIVQQIVDVVEARARKVHQRFEALDAAPD